MVAAQQMATTAKTMADTDTQPLHAAGHVGRFRLPHQRPVRRSVVLDHQSLSIFVFACVAVLTAANSYLLKTWAGNMSTARRSADEGTQELAKTMQTVTAGGGTPSSASSSWRDLGRLAGRECGYEGCRSAGTTTSLTQGWPWLRAGRLHQ